MKVGFPLANITVMISCSNLQSVVGLWFPCARGSCGSFIIVGPESYLPDYIKFSANHKILI